jgi:HEAT repeat protein
MSDPLKKTFKLLTSSPNASAVDLTIAALAVTNERTQQAATTSLLKRSSTRGQVEVVRRFDRLCPDAQRIVEEQVSSIEAALRQCLLHGDADLRRNALEIVRLTGDYQQIPALLELLRQDDGDVADTAAETIRDLVSDLHEYLTFDTETKAGGKHLRNAPQVKHEVLTSFNQACTEFDTLTRPRNVVEGVLVLGDPENFAVKTVLWKGSQECRELAGQLLLSSNHPGVMQLVLDSLSQNYPHPKVFEAISTRDDLEFVSHVLQSFPKRLTSIQQKNFHQIEHLPWIDRQGSSLSIIPPGLQVPLVAFVAASGLSSDEKLGVQEWIVRHGAPEGRLAASAVISSLDASAMQGIVTESLDAKDPETQAWATAQLRSSDVPEAIVLLIERLDSPVMEVRNAARDALSSFNVSRMLEMFDSMQPELCRNAGALMVKISPESVHELSREMANPIRRHRIRAAHAALAMGLQEQVLPSLMAMLEDGDALVRRTGAELLAEVTNPAVVEVLGNIKDDPSQPVRDTARKSLEAIHNRMAEAGSVCR